MILHALSGLPRSGSTLLANILNQNPKFYVSSTSPIGLVVQGISNNFSEQTEIISNLIKDPRTQDKMVECVRALIQDWYSTDRIVFDKGRVWTTMGLIHRELYPESKMLVMVRDPRDVYASMEKQHRKNPMQHPSNIISSQGIVERAELAMSPEGMIGGAIIGVMDLIHRKLDVVFIKYEDFVEYPERTMKRIYAAIKEDYFEHDFDHIKNTSQDVDALFHNKYPHNGDGKVENRPSDWHEYLSDELAKDILDKYPLFARHFNYD